MDVLPFVLAQSFWFSGTTLCLFFLLFPFLSLIRPPCDSRWLGFFLRPHSMHIIWLCSGTGDLFFFFITFPPLRSFRMDGLYSPISSLSGTLVFNPSFAPFFHALALPLWRVFFKPLFYEGLFFSLTCLFPFFFPTTNPAQFSPTS